MNDFITDNTIMSIYDDLENAISTINSNIDRINTLTSSIIERISDLSFEFLKPKLIKESEIARKDTSNARHWLSKFQSIRTKGFQSNFWEHHTNMYHALRKKSFYLQEIIDYPAAKVTCKSYLKLCRAINRQCVMSAMASVLNCKIKELSRDELAILTGLSHTTIHKLKYHWEDVSSRTYPEIHAFNYYEFCKSVVDLHR